MARAALQADGIAITGPLTLPHLQALEEQLHRLLQETAPGTVSVRLHDITALDTAGAVFLERLPAVGRRLDSEIRLGPVPDRFKAFHAFVSGRQRSASEPPAVTAGCWERLGGRIHEFNGSLTALCFVASELSWAAVLAAVQRTGVRRGSLVEQSVALGSSALPIIGLILFLIGAVSSLQAAAQLRKFGADIFVAELLAIGITRELGPLMTAIIVAGRGGSSIAAEVATMKFTEELDALQTMSLDPLRFVAVPKLWAMLLCVPMLTVMADFFGIVGGVAVAVALMGLSLEAFVDQVISALLLRDILSGLVKSISFAWAITVVGVFRGLGYSGGAAGVGRATTAAVVTSIFVIIVLDSFWGVLFYLR